MAEDVVPKRKLIDRFLDFVERNGNRLPDPITMFAGLAILVILLSAIFAAFGVSVTHPSDGKIIEVQSLLTQQNIRRIFTEMVKNFSSFHPLGIVLVAIIGIGVAERSGYIGAALRKLVTSVPKSMLSATLVFAGVMSNLAADAGYVILTPLGAMLFAAFGRHPIAGLAAAFAGVSGGFSANLLVTSLDPLLGGITTTSAQLLDKSYTVQATANYYFMFVSTFLLTAVGTWITDKVVEPRLGVWNPSEANIKIDNKAGELTDKERKGLKYANLTLLVSVGLCLFLALPQNAILRDDTGNLKPFYDSLIPIIMLVFLFAGVVYGLFAGTIKNDKDVSRMASEQMATMGAYIVLAFAAAQFISYFSWSNFGLVIAVTGADLLKSLGISGIPLLISFIIVTAFINLFIGSASAKWAVMGPVFVPMFMIMGYSPELIQNTYRVGDSVTNIISPLLPYFPIIIAFSKKYSPKVGLGTLISVMIPYSAWFFVMWSLLLGVWYLFGIPLGPDAPMHYTPPTP